MYVYIYACKVQIPRTIRMKACHQSQIAIHREFRHQKQTHTNTHTRTHVPLLQASREKACHVSQIAKYREF